jgi:DivIVA domain-containing protein
VHEERRDDGGQQENLHAATVRKLRRQPGRVRRESVVSEVQTREFPIVFRGYEKEAVDGFLRDLAAKIAELETTQSSDAVIKSALEEVGEETSAILQQAHESADEITRRSRAKADDRLRQAEGEAQIIIAEAERRARELDSDVERVWQERERLIEDLRQLAEDTLRVADDALERFAPPIEEEQATAEVQAPADMEAASDTQEAAQRDPAAESRDGDAGQHQHHDQ